MDFTEVHEKFEDDIKVIALSQRVPGLDYDDVVSEMTVCLWKAHDTWDPQRGTFGSYWWSLWLNRRSDITEAANRQKRPKHVLTREVRSKGYTMGQWPEPPEDADHTAVMVWNLLASGEPVKDVIERTGLSRRAYYSIIQRWRTSHIRSMLMP